MMSEPPDCRMDRPAGLRSRDDGSEALDGAVNAANGIGVNPVRCGGEALVRDATRCGETASVDGDELLPRLEAHSAAAPARCFRSVVNARTHSRSSSAGLRRAADGGAGAEIVSRELSARIQAISGLVACGCSTSKMRFRSVIVYTQIGCTSGNNQCQRHSTTLNRDSLV